MGDITNASGVITAIGIFVDFGTAPAKDIQYICAVNERAHTVTSGENTVPVVEVCGPGAPVSTWRSLTETQWAVTGSGRAEIESFDLMRVWRDTKVDRDVYIVYYKGEKSNLVAHGYYKGRGVLRSYDLNQDSADGLPTASINIQSGKGSAEWTVGAPVIG